MRLFSSLKTSVSNLLNQSLIYSVSHNNIFLAKCCIKCGADVNILHHIGFPLLYHPILKSNQEMVELLLAKGANPKLPFAYTSLYAAAYAGNPKIVELLLKNSVTPRPHYLSMAVEKGHVEVVDLLVKSGVKSCPLQLSIAVEKGRVEAVDLFLKLGGDPNQQDFFGENLLRLAIRHDQKEMVKLLLAKGANPNQQDHYGVTALDRAMCLDKKEMIELLLQNGADPNLKTTHFTLPFEMAIYKNNLEVAELLLKHKADPNRKTNDGRTMLHVAIRKDNLEVVELLLKNGANPNQPDCYGQRPLHVAVHLGNQKIIELLLKNGAIPNLQDNKGYTPWGKQDHQNKMTYYLRSNHKKQVKEENANVDAQDEKEETPLYYAAKMGSEKIVKLLSDYNDDTEVKNSLGYTSLYYTDKTPEILLDYMSSIDKGWSESNNVLPVMWTQCQILELLNHNHSSDNVLRLTGEESAAESKGDIIAL